MAKRVSLAQMELEGTKIARYALKHQVPIYEAGAEFGFSGSKSYKLFGMLKTLNPELHFDVKEMLYDRNIVTGKKATKRPERKEVCDHRQAYLNRVSPIKYDHTKYKSLSGREQEWPNTYIVKAQNILFPDEYRRFRIKAKSSDHAKDIYLLLRDYQELKYLTPNKDKLIVETIGPEVHFIN